MLSLHYQARFGLARGAVCKDGLPHLYLEGYEHDPSPGMLGTRLIARVSRRAGAMAFLALPGGEGAVLDAPQDVLDKLTEGAAVEIVIAAEARGDKLARARFLDVATGEPRRVSPVLNLKDRLVERAVALLGATPVEAEADDDMLDLALGQARDPSGELPGGGWLSVEPTRALIACDVDSAGGTETSMIVKPKAMVRVCNEAAVRDLPRRLRLSGYAGLVVLDLIGRRHDGDRLRGLLLDAFAAEAPHIIMAPITRFGTLEFTRPWGACPTGERLDHLPRAHYLMRKAARLSVQDRGRSILIRAFPAVLDILRPLISGSLDPLAPMLRLEAANALEVTHA